MLLHRSILRQCLAPFAIATGVVAFVLFMGRLRWLGDIAAEGRLTGGDLALTVAALLPSVTEAALPFGALAAVYAVVQRHSQQHEVLVMRLAGFSLWRYAIAVLAFGAVVAALAAVLAFWLKPAADARLHVIKERVQATYTGSRLVPGRFARDLGDKVLWVGQRLGPNEFGRIFFADRVLYPEAPIVVARRGRLEVDEGTGRIRLHLAQGTVFLADARLALLRTLAFDQVAFDFRKSPVEAVRVSAYNAMSTPALLRALAADDLSVRRAARLGRELAERAAVPLTCLAFALLGIPAGMVRYRSGRQGALLATLVVVLVYYLVWTAFRDQVFAARIAPAWLLLPPVLLAGWALLGIRRLERSGA